MNKLMFLFFVLLSFNLLASTRPSTIKSFGAGDKVNVKLLKAYKQNYPDKKDFLKLKKSTLALRGRAVPVLIKVMKSSKFPEKNRWLATFLLGQIMGKKSGPFLAKFLVHPSWVMRVASLKTLLALGQKRFGGLYARGLSDVSMIVRSQALDNISQLNLTKYAPNVWAMLYDKKNYHMVNKSSKRTHIVKSIIKTVGNLKFKKAKKPLLAMVQKQKYKDIFPEIIFALEKITGRKSPKGGRTIKKIFWKRYALGQKVI